MKQTTISIAAVLMGAIGCEATATTRRIEGRRPVALLTCRGGGSQDDDDALDAYINELIASVEVPVEEIVGDTVEKIEKEKHSEVDDSELVDQLTDPIAAEAVEVDATDNNVTCLEDDVMSNDKALPSGNVSTDEDNDVVLDEISNTPMTPIYKSHTLDLRTKTTLSTTTKNKNRKDHLEKDYTSTQSYHRESISDINEVFVKQDATSKKKQEKSRKKSTRKDSAVVVTQGIVKSSEKDIIPMDGESIEAKSNGTETRTGDDGTGVMSPMKKSRSTSGKDVQLENEDNESTSVSSESAMEMVTPPQPPNAVYRFLLSQGRFGHIIIMIIVWLSECIQTFIPPLATLFAWIASILFPGTMGNPRNGPYVPPKNVNEQYAGFVSTDGTSVRGKRNKGATKKADQKALEQLRRIGSVQEAKYRHVSVNFMKRHKIGPYSTAEDRSVVADSGEFGVLSSLTENGNVNDDEDTSWVVKALTKPEPSTTQKERETRDNPIRTTVSLGTDGASIGVELSLGGNAGKKSKKKQSSILEAATRTSSSSRRRIVRPQASDRDGGGGVMGRLRDLSSKNLMSRSLFGAYPGDAVPPSDAASAEGVITLAQRYGYGDWSDDDDDDDVIQVKRRRKKSGQNSASSTPKRKKSLSMRGPEPSLSFEFDPAPRPTSPSQEKSNSAQFTKNALDEFITSTKKRDVLVRPPMERLNEARRRLEETQE